jgi:uncharacterized protein
MEPIRSTRRQFLSRAVAATLAVSMSRGGRAAGTAHGPYLDVHTHLGTTWNGDSPLTAEALLRWMDDHDVAKAVVLPLVSPESSSYLNLTERAIDAARAHPGRLIPFCCIDPRTSYRGGRASLRAMLKAYVEQGAKGFGEHKAGLPIDDRRMMALYEVCDDLELPVLFHCDDQRGTDAPGLPGLERVLTAFPKVNFIGHGPGFWASISGNATAKDLGGYPNGHVVPGGALDRLFDTHTNLWGDLSADSGANAVGRDRDFGRSFLLRRANRLLFGTDYLKPGQPVPQFDLLARFDLPQEVEAKIYRRNAIRLLKVEDLK